MTTERLSPASISRQGQEGKGDTFRFSLNIHTFRLTEYGKTLGMYTEADPAEMNLGSISGRSMDGREFKDEYEIEHTFPYFHLYPCFRGG